MDSNDLLNQLKRDIQAQIEAENNRTQIEAERLHEIQAVHRSLQRLDKVSARLDSAIKYFQEQVSIADALREIAEQLPLHIERLERLILILSKSGSPGLRKITRELESEITESHVRSLQRQLVQQHQNYNQLQEKSAEYGGETPISLTNQIIKVTQEIERLETELKYFKELS